MHNLHPCDNRKVDERQMYPLLHILSYSGYRIKQMQTLHLVYEQDQRPSHNKEVK